MNNNDVVHIDHLCSYSGIRAVEINFLCVHKKLRSKRLAPVLIKEVTRRVNLQGIIIIINYIIHSLIHTRYNIDIWQAVYTAGTLIPKPLAKNRYPRSLIL